MEWQIDYSKESGVILVKVIGTVTINDARQVIPEIVSRANQHTTTRLLVDTTQATHKLSLPEIYRLPSSYYENAGYKPTMKLAIVFKPTPENKRCFRFLETTSRNQFVNTFVFTDRKKALNWLNS